MRVMLFPNAPFVVLRLTENTETFVSQFNPNAHFWVPRFVPHAHFWVPGGTRNFNKNKNLGVKTKFFEFIFFILLVTKTV